MKYAHKPNLLFRCAARALRIGLIVVLAIAGRHSAAKAPREDLWRSSETLVARLGAEWYKIGILRRELSNINDVVADLRNFELFPEEITRLNEKSLIIFDKRIEAIEKRHRKIGGLVDAFATPLSDAIMIVREMATDKPVKDMLRILEQGDIDRIERMLEIKHGIDVLWKEVDSLTITINSMMGFKAFEEREDEGLSAEEKEFFDIIRANLGKQSEEYYGKMNQIKDSLVRSRSNDAQKQQAFSVEIHLVNEYLQKQNWGIALQRVQAMEGRYTYAAAIAHINAVLARANFALGDFRAAHQAALRIAVGTPYDTTRNLFAVQSLYALMDYEGVWNWRSNINLAAFAPAQHNLIIWLLIESGLACRIDFDYSQLAGNMTKEAPYHLQIMHALARSYMLKGKIATTISVLESALLVKPRTDDDRAAYRGILLTLAQAHYENREYDRALKRYFELLGDEQDFEEALYGMAWCYIRLGMFQKAEATLRKLINQDPASPLAAEAILLMARRFMNKAQFEWKKAHYLTRESARLGDLIQKLTVKTHPDSIGPKYNKYRMALDTVKAMKVRLDAEKPAGQAEILSYYKQVHDISKLIQDHYETGSFQEVKFSQSREKLLHIIDSLLIAIGGAKENIVTKGHRQAGARHDLEKIKSVVRQSTMLTVEADIDQYRWEQEYLEWQKSLVADQIKEIDAQCKRETDSLARAQCTQRKRSAIARIDSLIGSETRMQDIWYAKLTTRCAEMLRTPLDTADEIYLRYHLGELYYTKENDMYSDEHDEYEIKLAEYEKQLALFRDGDQVDLPEQPLKPVLSHARSMKQYQDALRAYPNNEGIAPVIYSLAWCFSDLGKFDSAVVSMTRVARDFPGSPYAPQAWMYLGEHYFENGDLDKSIVAYQSVMRYPESEWFDEALYKVAWAHYRKSNPGKAISSFLALVDLGEGELAGKSLLEKESIDYIAISFSENDPTGAKGLEQASVFVDKLNDPDRATQILHRLANVYRQQGRFDLAKNSYQTLLNKYPSNKNTPRIESEYCGVLERDMSQEEACKMNMGFFEKYSHESAWAKAQKDTMARREADSLAAGHLYDAALSRHQLALQQTNNQALYNDAAKTYEKYIRTYPQSPAANECHYNFAEILFSGGNYQKAAEEYITVSKRYPSSKYKETAAWNAIVASQNLLKQEEKTR